MPAVTSPYVATAFAYAQQVTRGEIAACRWLRLACQRQLEDLARWSESGPYWFDQQQAHRVCLFLEGFGHVHGVWASRGLAMHLEPWQAFQITTLFGWRRRDTRARRFRLWYLELARKNGKTTLAAVVALYLLCADSEAGATIVSAATTREQARLSFNDAHHLVERDARFRKRFGVWPMANAITQLRTASTFKPLSAEGKHLDGLNIHGAIVDEFHAHRNRELWDVLETATGSRRQPLLFAITTAGANQYGVCYEVRSYLTKILEGTVADETVGGSIYTLDEGDDALEAANWPKANPNLGVSVYLEDIESLARKAKHSPASLAAFQTTRANQWVTAFQAWLDLRYWRQAAAGFVLPEPGEFCYVGLDLATKSDLIAECLWFPPQAGSEKHRLVFRLWIPERALEQEENALLETWARQGYITVVPGNIQDFEALADVLEADGKRYEVRELAADPWQLPPLLSILNRRSFEIPVADTKQTTAVFSPAMKETEAWLLSGQIAHEGNPAVAWMVSNVVCRRDANDNYFPRKQTRANKIDAPVAMFLAADRVIRAYQDVPHAYMTRSELRTVPFRGFAEARGAGVSDELAGL
jgi:phage terminase large subunit-like protein